MPRKGSASLHSGSDLELDIVLQWVGRDAHSSFVDSPLLGSLLLFLEPNEWLAVGVLVLIDGEDEVAEVLELLVSVVEGLLGSLASPWSHNSGASENKFLGSELS